ncbi:hypothetical protein HDU96_004723, partial [Phlyctochytrium bullatum]
MASSPLPPPLSLRTLSLRDDALDSGETPSSTRDSSATVTVTASSAPIDDDSLLLDSAVSLNVDAAPLSGAAGHGPGWTIQTHSLNHVSRETLDVDRMAAFYKDVLGFVEIRRPPITECKGVWLIIPNAFHPPFTAGAPSETEIHPPLGSVSLHIIHKDDRFSPAESPLEKQKTPGWETSCDFPERPAAVRRSHHLALRTVDVDGAEEVLRRRGIKYHKDYLPGTDIKQLFFYDPDGNGIE